MVQSKNLVVAVILGVSLAFASVLIMGMGAAIALPAGVIQPVVDMSGLLGFTLIDLITIAIPLAAVFLVVGLVCKYLLNKPDIWFYVTLLAPLLILQVYLLIPTSSQLEATVSVLPRFLLLAACLYFMVRSHKPFSAE